MRYFGIFHWSGTVDGTMGTIFAGERLEWVIAALHDYLMRDPGGRITLVRMPSDYI